MVSAALEVLGSCCFDVEDTSSSRRCSHENAGIGVLVVETDGL